MSPPLVLASTSRWRRELLARLGLPFLAVDPGVDEEPAKALGLPPRELVRRLAIAKAEAALAMNPGALVIGGDQVACVDDLVLGKPGTIAAAEAQLALMAGRTHELISGTALLDGRSGQLHFDLDVHQMTMRALTPSQIRAYVAREQPLDAAGSYYIEGLGIALFDSLRGDDYTAIMGLPLTAVVRLLDQAGIDVFASAPGAAGGPAQGVG